MALKKSGRLHHHDHDSMQRSDLTEKRFVLPGKIGYNIQVILVI